ncbi:trypsin-like peptidase domain-containing protein [Paenimyroides viscosum]|uniref:PDZ domain-containing protein n=1 Tax=Paenimyroides viscosum TaxID=2488729 RepID=A0A3P1AN84_9FLAO|nr:trypsin-like peptidase domain-containing protein [Paenimyroides viscosum]RRA90407.1 PDZ domain-containing protein [Paenimyroides viscosum]
MKNIGTILTASLISGAVTLGSYKLFFDDNSLLKTSNTLTTSAPLRNVANTAFDVPDFKLAAEKTIHAVVHVKNVSFRNAPRNPIMEYFYGYQGGDKTYAQVGTGSGVIISEDGYIVTNNHVIQNASELEITLNDNRTFKAKLIGTDSKMDIALLKIDTNEKLPFTVFADSDAINVGDWVLAVGNPYNLTSTVTAGIVSAKARNLSENGIQSFIQTDAAVNPGNSGGALVNGNGELIGINTMISSATGSYVGYSFAIPSNMTRKIVNDLMEYGKVQQGILGVQGYEINSQVAAENKLNFKQGFYVESVTKNSGAELAGIQKGDIIYKIDNKGINSFLDLNSIIATKRPNDEVKVSLKRKNEDKELLVKLSKKELAQIQFNGFEIENLSAADQKALGINYGVKINGISNERYKPYESELKNAIILAVNGSKIQDTEHANEILSKLNNQQLRIDLITPKGERLRMIL